MKKFANKTLMGGFALAAIVALNMAHAFNHYGYLDYNLNPNVLAQTNSSGGSSGGSSSGGSSSFDIFAKGADMTLESTGSTCTATVKINYGDSSSGSVSGGGSIGIGVVSGGASGGTTSGSSSGIESTITYNGTLSVCVEQKGSYCSGAQCTPLPKN